MKTRITELLGIKYPIIQGGMAWVAEPPLTAAVSNAGGLGTLTGTYYTPEVLSEKIKQVKALTDKPFAANFTPGCADLEGCIKVCVKEGVRAITYGRGKGTTDMVTRLCRPHGILSIPDVGNVRQAVRVESEGADAVIVSGMDAGGHVSRVGTMALIPQAVSKVKVPLIAAGGFGDGRGLAAALALGADAIQMGTRFMCTQESPTHISIKQKMIASTEEDTIITGQVTGIRVRCLKNKLTEAFMELEDKRAPEDKFHQLGVGKGRLALVDGDAEWGSIGCGQVVGMIKDIPTCKELIERMVAEAEAALDKARALFAAR